MNRFCLSLIFALGLSLLCPAYAQLPPPRTKATSTSNKATDAKAEADSLARERRDQARSLLISLASDARSFRDQALRSRSLARIADALWEVDAEQGRALFRKAWEAAETAEKESNETLHIKEEILRLAARRDRPLTEEFLQKLKADKEESSAQASETNLWELAEASEKRLGLANSLLRTGDVRRALQFADPVLGSITISTLDFLTRLREKDPAAADQRYAAMLASTAANMAADANTISLLSSYIFTPRMYVTFNDNGGSDNSWMRTSYPPANVDARLRLAFFQTASHVLLRPLRPLELGQGTTGIESKYMVVKRLLPLFERYAPPAETAGLRAQFEILTSLVSESLRQDENEWTTRGILPDKQPIDRETSLLDQIERANTSNERDNLYFKLALLALSNDGLVARDYVNKIDESGLRKRALAWVDWSLAIKTVEQKKLEVALELARTGELTHIQRVWIWTRSAKLLAATDRDKAISLLDRAVTENGRIDASDLDRPRGLLAIANAQRVIDLSRAWDAAFEAIKAANSTEGFSGENGLVKQTVNTSSQIMQTTEAVPDFDIEGLFATLAISDYDRTVQLARGFQGEAPRANATIAIARAVLNEKIAVNPTSTPQPAAKKY